jgi:hypothetical protein
MVNVPDDLYVERKGRIERVVAQARLLDATPGVDRSGSRPTAPVAPRVGPVRMRHPRIALQSCCGGPAPCSPSNHEDSHGTEQPDRVDERGGPLRPPSPPLKLPLRDQ